LLGEQRDPARRVVGLSDHRRVAAHREVRALCAPHLPGHGGRPRRGLRAHRQGEAPNVKRYDGEVAVVTGASSGLGRRLAVDLSARGATVVGIARRQELLDELQKETGAETMACDVADADAYRAALKEVEGREGRIDVLIGAAGLESHTPATGAALDDFRTTMDVNFFGVVTGTLAVLPGMVERHHGIVVNVSSDSARAPAP